MAKALPLKTRARFGSHHKLERYDPLSRIEHTEERLKEVADEVLAEIDELEQAKKLYPRRGEKFSWLTGQLSVLTLQDFVGAAFGAIFFTVTQEVWELAAKLNAFGMLAIFVLSFVLGFCLVFLSRRRKTMDETLHIHSFTRAAEIYAISFITALGFIIILGTAPTTGQILPQAIIITLPAVVSAATADLLFF